MTSALSPTGYSLTPRPLKSRSSMTRPTAAPAAATASGDAPRRARISPAYLPNLGFSRVRSMSGRLA
ncbi:MAG: hypothetical protein HY820_44640 [Acidobacteria bacterium]|nr:hypothetical protein [Acidobacteriota bacterium]